jgi:hypothetical protein
MLKILAENLWYLILIMISIYFIILMGLSVMDKIFEFIKEIKKP